MAHNFHPVAAPSVLHKLRTVEFNEPCPTTRPAGDLGCNNTTTVAGWEAVAHKPFFRYAVAEFTQPHIYSSVCGSGASVAIWAGLGAVGGSATGGWAQAGTVAGGQWDPGLSANQGWFETFGNLVGKKQPTDIYDAPIFATPGAKFEVTVDHDGSSSDQWLFSWYNESTGKSTVWAEDMSAPTSFTTANFFIERLSHAGQSGDLANFRKINFDISVASSGISKDLQPIPFYSYAIANMWSGSDYTSPSNYLLATVHGLGTAGNFSINQDHCH